MLKKYIAIAAGPLLAALMYCVLIAYNVAEPAARMAGVVVWVAVWWLSEAVHLGITSLIPFILLPVLGITKTDEVAMQYMDQIIFLFIGGFFLAYAMEKWRLHERIAFRIIMLVGNTPAKILLGVMLTSYCLSMWVSNTATVMMLIAAVIAIVNQKEIYPEHVRKQAATAILVGLSFSATIGGMGTLVGTPPNMIFYGVYTKTYPDNHDIDFFKWMLFGVPFSFTMLMVCYAILKRMFIPPSANIPFDIGFVKQKHADLGPLSSEEKVVLSIFIITVLLWFFREPLNLEIVTIPGWSTLFGKYASYIKDSTVVIFTSLFLFLIPSSRNKNETLLGWKDVERIPLYVLLLFGAGFAIAKGFDTSGLSTLLAQQLQVLKGAPVWLILLSVAIVVTLLSEFASNTASIQLVLPIIIPLAASLNINPLLLMLMATFSASLGYMLPVATAANTIVYGSNQVEAKDMMRAGIILDIAGIALLMLFMLTLGNWVYGFKIF